MEAAVHLKTHRARPGVGDLLVVDAGDLARVLCKAEDCWNREHVDWEMHFSTWLSWETIHFDPDHIGLSDRRIRTLLRHGHGKYQKTVGLWTADLVLVACGRHYTLVNGEIDVFRNPRRRSNLEAVENTYCQPRTTDGISGRDSDLP